MGGICIEGIEVICVVVVLLTVLLDVEAFKFDQKRLVLSISFLLLVVGSVSLP